MKKLFIISAILIFLIGCRKDPLHPDYLACSCQIDSASTSYFEKEQYDFAYQEISNDPNHIGHYEIDLDAETVYYYRGRLSAIYQKALDTTGSLHDMIFKYKVHNYKPGTVVLSTLTIGFIDSSSLRTEFMNNPGYTSSEFLNSLYLDYGFNSFYFSQWSPTVIMSSPNNYYNVQHIKNQLMQIDQIEQVWLDQFGIDGPSITHEKIGDIDEFVFGYGWGDCPSGCFGHHYWRVQVDSDCNVALVEEFGDDIPE